jgi:putative spermidine/putrescine transport system permease protein
MSSIALPRISARDHSESLRPLALAAPLLLLLLFSFLAPIASLLSRAVYEPTIANALPRTIAALRQDSSAGVPSEPVFVALATDLKEAQAAGTLNEFAKALLSAFDLRWTDQGGISAVPPDQAVFLRVFGRTFLIATLVTLATLALAFPLAYLMTNLRPPPPASCLFWCCCHSGRRSSCARPRGP